MIYFLLLLAALLVAALGWWVRRRSWFWGQTLLIIGGAGCLAVMGWQVRQSLFPPAAKPANRAHAVVSFYLATQTQQEVAGKSGAVVLIFPPTTTLDAEAAQTYANAFSAPLLRGRPELEIQTVTLESPRKGESSGSISLAAYQQALARFPNALAFVSYAAVPADIAELFSAEPSNRPPFFLFDPDRTLNWLTALKKGRIRSVIVPRPGVDLAKGAGVVGGPGELFGQFYLMATPANADQVAAQLAATR
jgi:hypothetical protein